MAPRYRKKQPVKQTPPTAARIRAKMLEFEDSHPEWMFERDWEKVHAKEEKEN